jgi:hypothetical protein
MTLVLLAICSAASRGHGILAGMKLFSLVSSAQVSMQSRRHRDTHCGVPARHSPLLIRPPPPAGARLFT